jgi:hypothetical protein
MFAYTRDLDTRDRQSQTACATAQPTLWNLTASQPPLLRRARHIREKQIDKAARRAVDTMIRRSLGHLGRAQRLGHHALLLGWR